MSDISIDATGSDKFTDGFSVEFSKDAGGVAQPPSLVTVGEALQTAMADAVDLAAVTFLAPGEGGEVTLTIGGEAIATRHIERAASA